MTLEELDMIRMTEDEADNIIKESLTKSRQIVSEEESNSYLYLEQSMDEESRNAQVLLGKTEIKAKEEAKKILEHAQHQSNLVRSKAKENFEKAVDFVIERIVEI